MLEYTNTAHFFGEALESAFGEALGEGLTSALGEAFGEALASALGEALASAGIVKSEKRAERNVEPSPKEHPTNMFS